MAHAKGKANLRRLKQSVDRDLTGASARNPFSRYCSKVSSARLVRIEPLSGSRETIKLALISLPLFEIGWDIDLHSKTPLNLAALPSVHEEACRRLLVRHNARSSSILFRRYTEALTQAAQSLDANIVCFNELGFPTRPDGGPRTDAVS